MWHNQSCCVKCLNNTAKGGVTRSVCFGESVGAALAKTVNEKGVFKRSLELHSPGTVCVENNDQMFEALGAGTGLIVSIVILLIMWRVVWPEQQSFEVDFMCILPGVLSLFHAMKECLVKRTHMFPAKALTI